MELAIKPGKYVVAVSGGVDSMVLLDMLVQRPDIQLVVAHFEHGIRADSDIDRQFVAAAAKRYGMPFVFAHGNLGSQASEAAARAARYAFLRQAREERGAAGIITAHHQDDVLETAIINMLRGSGSRGLSALTSTPEVVRPLLNTPKKDLLAYAHAHHIRWREDSTNQSDRYLRNYLRHHITSRLDDAGRRRLLGHIEIAAQVQRDIDARLAPHIHGDTLSRSWFIDLPYAVSAEAMAGWLRRHHATFDRHAINRLTVFAKTARPGQRADVDARWYLQAKKNHINLVLRQPTGSV